MVISDLSYLAPAETSVVGGFIFPPVFKDNSKYIEVDQDAYGKSIALAFKGDAKAVTYVSNNSYVDA